MEYVVLIEPCDWENKLHNDLCGAWDSVRRTCLKLKQSVRRANEYSPFKCKPSKQSVEMNHLTLQEKTKVRKIVLEITWKNFRNQN